MCAEYCMYIYVPENFSEMKVSEKLTKLKEEERDAEWILFV